MATQQSARQEGWQQHITQWKNSTLSQAQYCKQHHLKESAFSYHKCKLIKRHTTSSLESAKPTGFIKLPVPALTPPQPPLTLHFLSGLSLCGITSNNTDLVKQLAEVLS